MDAFWHGSRVPGGDDFKMFNFYFIGKEKFLGLFAHGQLSNGLNVMNPLHMHLRVSTNKGSWKYFPVNMDNFAQQGILLSEGSQHLSHELSSLRKVNRGMLISSKMIIGLRSALKYPLSTQLPGSSWQAPLWHHSILTNIIKTSETSGKPGSRRRAKSIKRNVWWQFGTLKSRTFHLLQFSLMQRTTLLQNSRI